MQDINNNNNKLAALLETLTDFVDKLAEVKTNETTAIYYLQTIEQKQDTMLDLLRIIAANTTKK